MTAEISGFAALLLYTLIAIVLVIRDKQRRCENWSLYWLYVVNRLYLGLGFHWRSNIRCPFPIEGSAIVIGNHTSPMDPMLLWMNSHAAGATRRVRPLRFMTAREFSEMDGIVGWICRTMQTIPVDRTGKDAASALKAIRLLKNDTLLGIFPEGGINTEGGVRQGNPGIALLALTAKVPVFPVYIENSPTGKSMTEPFYRFQRVRVIYGEPVDLSDFHGQKKSPELLREITDDLMQRVADLGGVEYRANSPLRKGEEESRQFAVGS